MKKIFAIILLITLLGAGAYAQQTKSSGSGSGSGADGASSWGDKWGIGLQGAFGANSVSDYNAHSWIAGYPGEAFVLTLKIPVKNLPILLGAGYAQYGYAHHKPQLQGFVGAVDFILFQKQFVSWFQIYLGPGAQLSLLVADDDGFGIGASARFVTAFSFLPAEWVEIYLQPIAELGLISHVGTDLKLALDLDFSIGVRFLF